MRSPATVSFTSATPSVTMSDEALVGLARADRAAFGILYDRYLDPVYRYCYGRLRDVEQAEDATSAIFTRALAAVGSHRGPSFRAWLFTIAHNVIVNAWRDARPVRPLSDAVIIVDPSRGPEELAAMAEERRSVMAAVARLPEQQRQVVELRLAGLTGVEVAAALGISHAAVRATQRRALIQLRRMLAVGELDDAATMADDGEDRDAN